MAEEEKKKAVGRDPSIYHTKVKRKVRSYLDGVSYHPEWRYHEAHEYVVLARQAEELNESFDVPSTETDQVLVQYYTFLRFGECDQEEDFAWAHELFFLGETNGTASRIRAMALADQTDEQIAEYIGARASSVKIFLDLFYDVRRFLGIPAFKQGLVFPFVNIGGYDAVPDALNKERLWLAAAYTRGWEGLKRILESDDRLNEVDKKKTEDMIYNALLHEANSYTVALKTHALPRPVNMERWLQMSSIAAQNRAFENQGAGGVNDPTTWIRAIHGMITSRADLPPEVSDMMQRSQARAEAAATGETQEDTKVVAMRPANLFGSEKAVQPKSDFVSFPQLSN